MREIKFRQYKGNGEWHYWGPNIEDGVLYRSPLIRKESQQFTGLHDKNRKEIYEGDILHVFEVNSQTSFEYSSKVEWYESGFQVREPNDCIVPLACFYDSEDTRYPLVEIEVIGNIYENPDLIGE